VVSRQSAGSVTLDAGSQGASAVTTRLVSVYADRMGPDTLSLRPGVVALSVVSHLGVPATIDLERADWPDTIATAALVSTLGTFRDLFSTAVLAAGQQVAIGRLTFLAMGVAEPAALYASLGQGRAFKVIEAGLRAGVSIVAGHHGALNSTLGEVLLATFSSPRRAVEAALAVQSEVAAIAGEAGVDMARLMRIAVHEGPCLGATVADRLCYFGTTPSTALSLLEVTRGGEIVLTAAVTARGDYAGSIEVVELPGGPLEIHRMSAWQRADSERRAA
jgi:class 3 adenylate cyclase